MCAHARFQPKSSPLPDAYKPCIAKPALKTPSNVKDGRPALGLARLRARVFRQLLVQPEHRAEAQAWPTFTVLHCQPCLIPRATWRRLANASPRREVGLKSYLHDGDAIQIDLIVFDLVRRAMRAEAPLLANNISEWPA